MCVWLSAYNIYILCEHITIKCNTIDACLSFGETNKYDCRYIP